MILEPQKIFRICIITSNEKEKTAEIYKNIYIHIYIKKIYNCYL